MRIKKVEISDDVADVLRRGEWFGWLYRLPEGQLARPLYEAVDKVLRALGGKWARAERGHMFGLDAKEAMVAALDQGHVVDQKKTLEQFWTPDDLAARMVKALGITPGAHVLEPTAGCGRLVVVALAAGAIVTAVELDRDMIGHLIDIAAEKHGDLFVFGADFMEWTPASPVPIDFVLMNPPFSVNQDIRHVRQAFRWLRPGGKLAAIMSPHFTFAEDEASRNFRELIGYPEQRGSGPAGVVCPPSHGSIAAVSVEMLPANTFKQAGTGVSSVLVIMEKAI